MQPGSVTRSQRRRNSEEASTDQQGAGFHDDLQDLSIQPQTACAWRSRKISQLKSCCRHDAKRRVPTQAAARNHPQRMKKTRRKRLSVRLASRLARVHQRGHWYHEHALSRARHHHAQLFQHQERRPQRPTHTVERFMEVVSMPEAFSYLK